MRIRDLTPTANPGYLAELGENTPRLPPGILPGGADAFLDFIRDEAKPMIQEKYRRRTGDDTLMGDSLGGLFTLHALFTRPSEYTRYVTGTPSIWWGNAVLFESEESFAAENKDLDARLFKSVGGLEQLEGEEALGMVTNMHKMADLLELRNYPSLQMARHEFPDETHLSVISAAFSRGLHAVFGDAGSRARLEERGASHVLCCPSPLASR